MSKLFWDAQVARLRLNGSGARQFLQGQTSADLNALASGDLLQTCWLTATGRLRAVLELRLDAEGADVIVLAGEASAVRAGFDQVIFPADRVRLQPLAPLRRLQWLEPHAAALWCDPDAALPEPWASGQPASAAAFEQWRLQSGFPPGPGELNGETNPLELGLVAQISTEKGCYLGQETMAKLTGQAGVKQQLRCWSCPNPLAPAAKLTLNGERAGVITSALDHDGTWMGLALVRRQCLASSTLEGPNGEQLRISRPEAFQDPEA
ncbi:glycine cleavage T-protein [Synechococcus sp. KORDI-52]|uniref:CAF17-like 4Fe-4S cluster assembly/insertion protein YgfZ n=1 Tax=Synechococcus sp. KORDI-52 TaxID=585425 RepID=UPI0004E0944B|nr:glycine cleavage system protein T [Synechococcus sp. KORDI-52]AII47806.1 glycine cleavage T-protein [Synechococcus sp. KORDI-52]